MDSPSEFAEIELVVTQVDDRFYIGPRMWAYNGCGRLVASRSGRSVHVEGIDYGDGDGPCTQDIRPLWEPVELRRGVSDLKVTYKNRTGHYVTEFDDDTLSVVLYAGDDVSPPASESGWWAIPPNILIASVWYWRVPVEHPSCDEISQRLESRRAQPFTAPDGLPIARQSRVEPPDTSLEARRTRFVWRSEVDRCQVAYLSGLSASELQTVANEEAASKRCVAVRISRRTDIAYARAACEGETQSPAWTPSPTPPGRL